MRSVLMLALAAVWPSVAHALPLLSEVLYDAVGSDDGAVFVELYGAPGTSLAGLALEGVNGADGSVTVRVDLAGVIPADGLFVVADQAAGGGTGVAGADLLADFDFQNGPDSVRLVGPGGGVLDAVGYGVFGAGDVFAGEGAAAPDPAAGEAVARRFADVDSGDNAADFVAMAPSPGMAPLAGVPEPGTAALLAAGLALLRPRRPRHLRRV